MWKDTTSYSRDDKERNPTTFTTTTNTVKITVTCGHINHRGVWVMHAHPFGINTKELKAKTLEDAKAEAIGIVKAKAAKIVSDLDAISP